jgi:cyclopropane-fatty-acyl-phospholipid synthase
MMKSIAIDLAERRIVPERFVRWGVRRLLRDRLAEQRALPDSVRNAFFDNLREGPIATDTDKANEQHYELPPAFFERVLGRNMKYSGCYWPATVTTLDEAEEAMLAMTCERAGIEDGMEILDLGCGWGSLSLYILKRYPHCRVLSVSNSAPQREHILSRWNSDRLEVVTADVNGFDTDRRFDRVVSVEMFEHLSNYALLFEHIGRWLKEDGKLFVHVFCHKEYAYPFRTEGEDDWMGRYFFTGGLMPSEDLLPKVQQGLALERNWRVSGVHYQRTAEAWLRNLDNAKSEVWPTLVQTYGASEAARWFGRWRMFFIACAELFGYDDGQEWLVAHYLFRKSPGTP